MQMQIISFKSVTRLRFQKCPFKALAQRTMFDACLLRFPAAWHSHSFCRALIKLRNQCTNRWRRPYSLNRASNHIHSNFPRTQSHSSNTHRRGSRCSPRTSGLLGARTGGATPPQSIGAVAPVPHGAVMKQGFPDNYGENLISYYAGSLDLCI